MGIQHYTVVTCDRCGTDRSLDGYVGWERTEQLDGYAHVWPLAVVAWGYGYPELGPDTVVCGDCLTEAEREQLEQSRLQPDPLPF
jgi:hypothetical protein